MLFGIDIVSVVVSALLMLAVGSIWYSPLLFGSHWMRATGLTEADLELAKERMWWQLLVAFVVNFVLLFVIAEFVLFSESVDGTIKYMGTLLVVLLGAVLANIVIWEQKHLSYLLINIGYAAVVIFGGLSVIWYWPW